MLNWLGDEPRVLILCPHTDDEFGCAGTILRLIESGSKVRYVALSRCEESVPDGLPPDALVHECLECMRRIGIPEDRVEIGTLPVRHFPAHRQQILEHLVQIKNEWSPDLVLLPSSYDTHQDHATINQEGLRAFKNTSILGYELPQNLVSFANTAFVVLSKPLVEKKIEALSAYASQEFRKYSSADFIRGLAVVRGAQCNTDYAEAFEVIRLVIQ